MNTSRSKIIILTAGAAVIALALLLFVSAMRISDFAAPEQGPFQGRSNVLLAAAFVLLIGLAIALFFIIFRTAGAVENASVSGAKRKPGHAAPTRAAKPEGEALPVVAAEGRAEGTAGVISDTTEELRTTVDVIQDELEEILDDEVPADKVHMQSIYEETHRLKKIIGSMEQLTRGLEIARENRKELLRIEPLLNGIIEATRQAVPDKDVTYSLECEPGLAMMGNPECIGRIIGNIVDNAARSIKDSGSVMLTAGRRNDMIVFSVRDTGTGIRKVHRSHIYERFFRGTGTGIGMGLAIVKELVDACGGKIDVQTAVNEGTTFIVQMPAE